MPFCRKCGRRLVEYSEVCPDCGQSTTAPIINTKRTQASRSIHTGLDKKIAKAIIPELAPVQIKVIIDKPAKAASAVKTVSPIEAIAKPKASAPIKIVTPIRVAPTKAAEPSKPVISSKHIVKPKKATQTKPAAPFTLAHARPVAGLEAAQHKPAIAYKRVTPPKLVVASEPIAQQPPVPVLPPVIQPLPIIQVTPFAVTIEPAPPAKPVSVPSQPVTIASKPITPAPVYPPHEIIQSKVSIKEDILAHPEDYEKEAFTFDLKCSNGHFFAEGTQLPVSKGKAYCPQCGERLSKPKPKKRRYHRKTYFH